MTVDVSSFVQCFPEFAKAPSAMLTARLAQIELVTGDAWGAKRDLIVMLQLADALAVSPSGRDAQLSTPGEATTYRKQLWSLAKGLSWANDLRLGTVDPCTIAAETLTLLPDWRGWWS